MKTLILKSKFTLLTLLFIGMTSCSSDDDGSAVQTPTVSYATTTLEATFFQSGNSGSPSFNWNGNQGAFSLVTPLAGLDINTTTGILNWTKDLPIGTHNVEVAATNSAGQTTINLTLNNPLQGVFTGNTDTTDFMEIEFVADETVLITTTSALGTGTSIKNDATIVIDVTFDNTVESSLSGTLNIGSTAVYSGEWYFDHGAVSGNEGGLFEVILD